MQIEPKSASVTNARVVLKALPRNLPSISDFRVERVQVGSLGEEEVLLRTRYVSVDAHMRSHVAEHKDAEVSLQVGDVIAADGIAEVIASNDPQLRPNDLVLASTGWQTHPRVHRAFVHKLGSLAAEEPVALATLGAPALTVYSGLRRIGMPQAGETLVVPAALGAAGSMCAQIGRLRGLWTVGIVSNNEEAKFARQRLGFHSTVDHTRADFARALADACPDGIDIFIETVGGAFWRQIRPLLNPHARVILTGTWSQYNHHLGGAAEYESPATMEGVIRRKLTISASRPDWSSFAEFAQEMMNAIRDGKIQPAVKVLDGLNSAAGAWLTAIDGPDYSVPIIRVASL